jgi:hypothetical protein
MTGSCGRHDNYGFALSAQPGESQRRPATNSSSWLIVCIGLPTLRAPGASVPMVAPYATNTAAERWHREISYRLRTSSKAHSPHTVRSKGCLSNKTALAMIFKLAEAAEKSWRRLNGHNQLPKIILGIKFTDGIEIVRSQAKTAAA